MRSIDGRLSKLENRFGIARSATRYLLILMDGGRDLGPADDAYIKSLDDAGLLPTSGFGIVDLTHIPDQSAVKDGTGGAPLPKVTIELVSGEGP